MPLQPLQVKLVISTKNKYNGYKRITLTLPVINKSNKIMMIGSQKKLHGFNDVQRTLPIHMLDRKNMNLVVKI